MLSQSSERIYEAVSAACTWRPRGEMGRLQRLFPQFEQMYCGIAVSLPPDVDREDVGQLRGLLGEAVVITSDWSHGRHAALGKALEYPCDYVHYADMDRLLHWVETRPEEWRRAVEAIPGTDCLIMGRTEQAYGTHPQAIRQTERIPNAVFSHLLGRPVDLSAGSKGFSRPAAEFLMAHSLPGRALGTDAEWPVLLHQAGFQLDVLWVDGLEWESADRYRRQAADQETQRHLAEQYDRDAANWARRVQIAVEIVQAGLDALQRQIEERG